MLERPVPVKVRRPKKAAYTDDQRPVVTPTQYSKPKPKPKPVVEWTAELEAEHRKLQKAAFDGDSEKREQSEQRRRDVVELLIASGGWSDELEGWYRRLQGDILGSGRSLFQPGWWQGGAPTEQVVAAEDEIRIGQQRLCVQCGETYTVEAARQRYCRPRCRELAWIDAKRAKRGTARAKAPARIGQCLYCGGDFPQRDSRNRWCSVECRVSSQEPWRRKAMEGTR